MQSSGHNGSGPAMSGVGLFYILLEVLWTMLLFLLIIKNIRIRASYAVRIRGLVLMTLQVLALHVYVSAIFIVYPLNGSYTCAAEFWMMNIIFPGALALFQASTVKLLAVHENQLALFHASSATDLHATVDRVKLPYLPWLTVKARNLKLAHHYKWISIGFAFQIALTFLLFFGSHKFGMSSAFFGDATNPTQCRRGWEWAPSIVWQFFFTWIYAPYLLSRCWRVKDIYLWSLQTMICVIAGIPGTPLWLAMLYGPQQKLTWFWSYMPPATWFAPGLMAMELTTLLMPIICANHARSFEAARDSVVAACETLATGKQAFKDDVAARIRAVIINNRAALNYQLEDHPGNTPFAKFCAQKAFVYHSVLFIRGTVSFKQAFSFGSDINEQFDHAAFLWFVLGDLDTSPFGGVNVPWQLTKSMRDMFRGITYKPNKPGPTNNAIPWEIANPPEYTSEPESPLALNDMTDPEDLPRYAQFDVSSFGTLERPADFIVPTSFLPSVFDTVREHIVDTLFKDPWRNYIMHTMKEDLLLWPHDRFIPKDGEHALML